MMQQNLPDQLIPLVGRDTELMELTNLLEDPQVRLVTLSGLGGSGKTRLAVEVGRAVLDRFTEGICFVPLAPLDDPGQIPTAAAASLGLVSMGAGEETELVLRYLREKHLLLILDNLEHLLPGGLDWIEALLHGATGVKVLVTSRLPLNMPWEWTYRLRGLDTSSENGVSTAAEFFLQQLRRSGYPAGEGDVPCAAQIGQMVNGLPLALLLASSWARALDCAGMINEIQRGITFLQARQKSANERHNSMQAVFDYSWRLISEEERAALRKLAVFRGGFDRAAAHAVAEAGLGILAALLDHALVERATGERYQVHELLRQYMHDRLVDAGEEARVRSRHLAYFTHLAEEAEPELVGPRQVEWIARLRSEFDNIVAALEWALDSAAPAVPELGLRMMVALERFWVLGLYCRTGLALVQRLQEKYPQEQGPRLAGRGLILAGRLSFLTRDLDAMGRCFQEVMHIGQDNHDDFLLSEAYYYLAVGDFHQGKGSSSLEDETSVAYRLARALAHAQVAHCETGVVQALTLTGRHEIFKGNLDACRTHLADALERAKRSGDLRFTASALRVLGELAMIDPHMGPAQAQAYCHEGLTITRRLTDPVITGLLLSILGEAYRMRGQYEQAAQHLHESISIIQTYGMDGDAIDETNLGFVFLRTGRLEESRAVFRRAFENTQKVDYLGGTAALCLMGMADLALKSGSAPLAAALFGAIEPYHDDIFFWPPDRQEYEHIRFAVQAQLSANEFASHFKEGQGWSLEEAMRRAEQPPQPTDALQGLTAREIDVLRLVAQGLTDQQVAEKLVISSRTVNAHLTNIYNKLGVSSRVAAAKFAQEKGLV